MLGGVTTQRDSLLWTLEEISHLVSHSGHPEETLDNIVQLIQRTFDTDVCSVYLLEPDRSTLVLAATVGLRPDSVGRVRMRLSEGLAGLVGEQLTPQVVEDATHAPAVQIFQRGGRRPVPLVPRRAAHRQGIAAGCARRADDRAARVQPRRRPHAHDGRNAARVDRQPGAHARDSSSRPRTSGWRRSRGTCGGAGITTPRASSARSIRCCGASSITTRSRCSSRFRSHVLEERASALVLHSRINYAYRRMQEHLTSTRTWGARNAGVLWARPVAYFSAEFGLHESVPIYSGGLGILAGDHIKAASDLGIPLVGVGLYYDQGYFTQRLDLNGYQQEDYRDVDSSLLPLEPARDASGEPVTVSIDTRTGTLVARVWKLAVGRNTLLLLDSDVEGNQPEDRELTSRLYGGDDRVRIRQELLLGVGGVKALDGARHLAGRRAPQRRTQRVRRAGAGVPADGDRRDRRRRSAAPNLFAGRLHDAHAGAGRPRSLLAADLVEEHLGPLRDALGMSRGRAAGARPRQSVRSATKASA